jgi:hypothetical protein
MGVEATMDWQRDNVYCGWLTWVYQTHVLGVAEARTYKRDVYGSEVVGYGRDGEKE